jgi:hypothetical protein
MMFSPGKQVFDDRLLIRYLLGQLPEEETERLDELSIVGDDFACRLRDVENDLVDAYASGELSGETLARFQSSYLSSPEGREKVKFARVLLASQGRAAAAPASNAESAIPPGANPRNVSRQRWRFFRLPRLTLYWGFAGAACLVLAGGGYLLLERQSLRSELDQAQADRTALQQRQLELQRQLDEQHPHGSLGQAGQPPDAQHVGAETAKVSRAPKTVAFLLLAETRGIGPVAPVAVPPGVDLAVLQLQLEFDDFPKYQAALKDPVTNQIVWRSQSLTAMSLARNRAVSASLPVSLLKPQNYTLELTGISGNGTAELIGSYSFRVVLK